MGIDQLRRETQAYKERKLLEELSNLEAEVRNQLKETDAAIGECYQRTMMMLRMACACKALTPLAALSVQLVIEMITNRNEAAVLLDQLEKY